MVSLWPWKGNDTSPASFEKALSTLSTKLTKANANLETCRQQARRLKALWTLYSSFAYLLYLMIVGLVIGWKSWGAIEYTSLSGGPLLIYLVRLGLATYYDYRTSRIQANVDALQKQRDATIDKLKAATKYNTTQQLLEKYGGTVSKPKASEAQNQQSFPKTPPKNGGRTNLPPPPTANIPNRLIPASVPSTPQRSHPLGAPGPAPPLTAFATTTPWPHPPSPPSESESFAPNAFPTPPQYAPSNDASSRWYDRIMDVLLGDDESHPKNRLALICTQCRLVNGQAPPGIKSLADVGLWRCASCGARNGEESEAREIIKQVSKQVRESGVVKAADEDEVEDEKEREREEVVMLSAHSEDGESNVDDDRDERELTSGLKSESEEESAGQADQDEGQIQEPAKLRRGRSEGVKKKA